MRKIKLKERNRAGNIYCSFCRPDKVDAVWRKTGFADHVDSFACEEHKYLIQEENDSYISEGERLATRFT